MSEIILTDADYLFIASSPSSKVFGRPITRNDMLEDLKRILENRELEPNCTWKGYYELRREIRTLCKRHLSISFIPRYQYDRIAVVLKHVYQEYQPLFETDKKTCLERLFLFRNLVFVIHGDIRRMRGKESAYNNQDRHSRTSHGKRTTRSKASSVKKAPPVRTIVSPPRTFLRRRPNYTPQMAGHISHMNTPSTSPVVTISPQKSRVESCPSHISVLSSPSPPSSPISIRAHPSLSSESSQPIMTSLETRSNTITNRRDQESHIWTRTGGTVANNVRIFLSTVCRPSLLYLSEHFSKYGCTTEEHLFRLATWEKKIRYMLLKDMLQGVTEMEILFLEKHLDDHFGL